MFICGGSTLTAALCGLKGLAALALEIFLKYFWGVHDCWREIQVLINF